MKTSLNKVVSALALSVLAFTLSGCEKEGPAEKAGKEIDKAVSSAGSQLESIGKEIESAVK